MSQASQSKNVLLDVPETAVRLSEVSCRLGEMYLYHVLLEYEL